LKSSYTRKGKISVAGFLDDMSKSVNRFYISNFQDKSRQEAIDLLLNNGPELKTPGRSVVQTGLRKRINEYSTTKNILVFCGTYNLNGKLNHGDSLKPWFVCEGYEIPDIAVIGVQELIQLTPGEVFCN
jgi:hypothetical protein